MSQPGIGVERLSFAVFTEPQQVEDSSETWAQHFVVFPPVYLRRELGKSVLREVTGNTYAFRLKLGEAGELSDQTVRFFETKRSILLAAELHKRVLTPLRSLEKKQIVDLFGVEHIGEDYLPHITQKRFQPRLRQGQEIIVDHLALVSQVSDNPNIQQILEINGLKNV